MASRLNLQTMLETLIGSENVYFQPPGSGDPNMMYPAIIYNLNDIKNDHANNDVYNQIVAYKLTVIDEDPDSVIVEKVSKLKMCSFVTKYTADELNHTVFKLFF